MLSSIKISLKFVPKDPSNNIPALVQTMDWRRIGDKPLSELMPDGSHVGPMNHPIHWRIYVVLGGDELTK